MSVVAFQHRRRRDRDMNLCAVCRRPMIIGSFGHFHNTLARFGIAGNRAHRECVEALVRNIKPKPEPRWDT